MMLDIKMAVLTNQEDDIGYLDNIEYVEEVLREAATATRGALFKARQANELSMVQYADIVRSLTDNLKTIATTLISLKQINY